MKKVKITLFIIFIINTIIIQFSTAQINRQGVPFIHNYLPDEYAASGTNWAAVQDLRGVMYFANDEKGVMEYDGKTWRKIPVSNETNVRSLAIDSTGVIYVGAVNEFGYLAPDAHGKMKYVSFIPQIPTDKRPNMEILKILPTFNGLYFHTNKQLFRFHNGIFDTVFAYSMKARNCFYINNQIFIISLQGLFTLQNDQFSLATGGEKFVGKVILTMQNYSKNELLLGFKNELKLYNPQTGDLTEDTLFNDAQKYIIEGGQLYKGAKMNNDRFVFTTLKNGILIMNKTGNIEFLINDTKGLSDNTVTYAYTPTLEQNSPLWITTYNQGLAMIETNSPFSKFTQNDGYQGSINNITEHNKMLYVATDNGVYYLDTIKLAQFKQASEKTMQAWSLLNYTTENKEEILIVATNEGVLQIENGKNSYLNKDLSTATWYVAIELKKEPNTVVLAGKTNDIFIITYKNDWQIKKRYDCKKLSIRSICEDTEGNLWGSAEAQGVIRIQHDDTLVVRYDTTHGLPDMVNIRPYLIDNQMVFATPKGLYRFNEQKQRFYNDSLYDKSYSTGEKGVFLMSQQADGKIWLTASDKERNWIESITHLDDGKNYVSRVPFDRLPTKRVNAIYHSPSGISWISVGVELYSFDNSSKRNFKDNFQTLIRQVFINNGDSVLFYGTNFRPLSNDKNSPLVVSTDNKTSLQKKLDYEFNTIGFEFAAPYFENGTSLMYSWYLEGYDDEWSHWTTESKTTYTNMSEGKYVFRVKARNVYEQESSEASYAFTIRPPWYRTWWAYIAYVVVLARLLWFVLVWNTRRLRRRNEELEAIVEERTKEVVMEKEKVEIAYENVKMLSVIGQDITSKLKVETIIQVAYQNINVFMGVSIFDIGLYNPKTRSIDFPGGIKNGSVMPFNSISLSEKSPATVCFNEEKEIIIDNLASQYQPYYSELPKEMPQSIIYLPLYFKGQKSGVLTVQSIDIEAYKENHINIVRNIAVYCSIALENADALAQIEHQKIHIEHVHGQITDSINYARRIQEAMLPAKNITDDGWRDYFVIFQPRDVVSGDFYWIKQVSKYHIFAAADCTGHGVPGAFMSMLGMSAMNEIINSRNAKIPGQIMDELRAKIKLSLKQTGNALQQKDGMDMALCTIDRNASMLYFAGAHNPLIIVRDKNLPQFNEEYKTEISDDKILTQIDADSQPIGISFKERPFTSQNISLYPGDLLYMFSDGIIDQVGGKSGRKFMKKGLKQLILSICYLPLEQQKDIIVKTINDWKGEQEQVDDMLMIGIKID